MTIQDAITLAQRRLTAAGIEVPFVDTGWLLAHVTGKNHLLLRLEGDQPLTPAQEAQFLRLLARREARIPLQHLLGTQPFLGHDFRTDSRALIPRPETALLAEMAIRHIQVMDAPAPRLLDVGTGTGCIAVSLALACPHAHVTAVDLSPDALSLARENADALGARITFLESDLLNGVAGEMFHLIISNPPYIPSGALPALQPEVQHDPALALDGGADGLAVYRRLIPAAFSHIYPGGMLMLEIGSDQGTSVPALMWAAGFVDVAVHRDYGDLERMVAGRKQQACRSGR